MRESAIFTRKHDKKCEILTRQNYVLFVTPQKYFFKWLSCTVLHPIRSMVPSLLSNFFSIHCIQVLTTTVYCDPQKREKKNSIKRKNDPQNGREKGGKEEGNFATTLHMFFIATVAITCIRSNISII